MAVRPRSAVLSLLLLLLGAGFSEARPPSMTQYFPPQYHPWAIGDIVLHDGTDLSRILQSDEDRTFLQPSSRHETFRDKPFASEEVRPSIADFNRFKGDGGYYPPGFADLNKVYWWEKRFNGNNNRAAPAPGDIPFFDDDDDANEIGLPGRGGAAVGKRDYTAAQLVNMLKNLARARRHRGSHVVGKGLRFGISK